MDLSALIFVALAVAWAVYLVPKALRQHEEDSVSRSVDGFSDRLRVLARREAVSATEATLVPTGRKVPGPRTVEAELADPVVDQDAPATPTPAPRDRPDGPSPVQRRLQQAAARRAADRRRRVFTVLLLAIIVAAGVAIGGVIAAPWVAVPAALMVAWLVACRLMVKRERAARFAAAPVRKRRRTLADEALEEEAASAEDFDEFENTDEIPVVTAALVEEPVVDPNAWTPVEVPLPTYVAKAPAGRTVRTIDLDSTGVWSSGRNEADSQLAREADAQRARVEADADNEQRRASGS